MAAGVSPENGMTATEQLVHQGANREDVRSDIHRLAAELLRRHVGHAAGEVPEARIAPTTALRDPEVEELHRPILEYPDVTGLDVPMDDTLRVGERQPGTELDDEPHPVPPRNSMTMYGELSASPNS